MGDKALMNNPGTAQPPRLYDGYASGGTEGWRGSWQNTGLARQTRIQLPRPYNSWEKAGEEVGGEGFTAVEDGFVFFLKGQQALKW